MAAELSLTSMFQLKRLVQPVQLHMLRTALRLWHVQSTCYTGSWTPTYAWAFQYVSAVQQGY